MITAIIVAAGIGSRMGLGYNKQFLKISDKEVIAYTIEAFEKVKEIDNIILVSSKNEISLFKDIINKYNFKKVLKVVEGGSSRQESVYNGLLQCETCDIVLIHDGARPFIKEEIIKESIKEVKDKNSVAVGVKVKDTVKKVYNMEYTSTLNREELYCVQTPQTFKYELILKAHKNALEKGYVGTDDTSLIEFLGEKVYIVNGDYFNIKITTKEDVYIGEGIVKALKEGV